MLSSLLLLAVAAEPVVTQHEFAPSPIDNPLKGLVPYQADVRSRFPHSLEFNYLPFAALNTGPKQYDWTALEKLLDDVASRGHQTVVRIYLEYPKKTGVIPKYLVDGGLKVHKYLYTETQPLPHAPIETPDYRDPKLTAALTDFISAFGKKYDGDPRLGYITAGLLGVWGEWHTYPRVDLHPPKAIQTAVMDAYEKAFARTPVLLRYPAGPKSDDYAANATRRLGYHDDSFGWATLETGKKSDDWFFTASLRRAGAIDKWKTQPIGGEIRPEAWGRIFDEKPGKKQIQDFATCVEATHATWLMDSGMFEKQQTPDRIARATEKVRRMGYDFTITESKLTPADGKLRIEVAFENRGVAPFYADWRAEYGVRPVDGKEIVKLGTGTGQFAGLLPADAPRTWTESFAWNATPGRYRVLVRVPNPLPMGHPLKFANVAQDRDVPGWLTLGTIAR
jgi:hypothetical protein